MDDDGNVNNDDLMLGFCCGGAGGSVFFRRWLIIDMSGFPQSKPNSAASIKPHSNYKEFFSVSDPPAPVRYFMTYWRISEIQPTSSERAARLLRECRPLFNILPLRRRAISLDILTFVTNAFSIQTIRASVVRSPYRNPVQLPLKKKKKIRAARSRCTNNFSRRFTMLLVLFRAFDSVTR